MKPQNTKERRNSFLKFLLMFVLTTALIIGAFYFNYRVPVKANKDLRLQVKRTENERAFQEDFVKVMKTSKMYLDSLSKVGDNKGKEGFFQKKLDDSLSKLLTKVPDSDSTYNAALYDEVVELYFNYNAAQKSLRDLRNAEEIIDGLQAKIDDCAQSLESYKRDYNNLQRQLNN